MSSKRHELMKPGQGSGRGDDIRDCDERVQALALLMLYYCSGLQQVQDLEEMEKDGDELLLLGEDQDEEVSTE